MLCNMSVLPAFGGDTINPLWPLPIGAVRSITLEDISAFDPEPCSRESLKFGKSGVKFSKRILFLALFGVSPFMVSICTSAKYLSWSFGGRIFPWTSSPFLSANFLTWLGET